MFFRTDMACYSVILVLCVTVCLSRVSSEKDTIDFLCLTCEEDRSKSPYTECCQNGLGLDYCCSMAEKGGDVKKAAGFMNDLLGRNDLKVLCAKNEDCPNAVSDDDEYFCCWGGRCCEVNDYVSEGTEAFFRSFGGYIIGSILLGLIIILFLSCCISMCCCLCKRR